MGVYSFFFGEDDPPLEQENDYQDGMWHIHVDGACSSEGNGE
jgi:hypothetical protein